MSNVSDDERLVVLLEARIRDFEKNMQKASGTAGREFGRMRQDARGATAQMEADMARSTSRMNQALATVSMRAGAMAAAFGPAALAIGASGAALTGFVTQARETARGIATIGDEAKRAGINVKAFQELKFVADQNRVSIDALTDGIKEMNLRADEFIVTGKGSGAEAFQRLGLTATDLAKKLKDPSALLTEIIGKVEGMDRAAQIRIFDEIFGGTGGEQFVQLIDQGAAGIRRTIDEANRLGIVMDEQMIAKAADVDRQFGAIAATVGTKLKGAIVEAAAALAGFMEGMRDFEDRQTSSLNTELEELSKRRLENEKRIAELRSGAAGVNKVLGEGAASVLEEETAAIGEQEKKIRDILAARGELNASTTATVEGLRGLANGSTQASDALGYVARNGGTATETTDTYSKAVADLRSRLSESVDGLQLQNDMLGQSEGALAAAQFEARAMADALRAAQAAGKDTVDENLARFIRDQAADYGRLTDQIAGATKAEQERQQVVDKAKQRQDRIASFEEDLAFERAIIGLPEAEQRVRQTLRGLDVEFDSFEGQRLAGAMRFNSAMAEQQDSMKQTTSLIEGMGDIFADVFGQATRDGASFFDSIIRGFAAAEGAIDNSPTFIERITA